MGLLDEKRNMITTGGKEEEDEAKNMDTNAYLQKSPKSDVQLYLRPLG